MVPSDSRTLAKETPNTFRTMTTRRNKDTSFAIRRRRRIASCWSRTGSSSRTSRDTTSVVVLPRQPRAVDSHAMPDGKLYVTGRLNKLSKAMVISALITSRCGHHPIITCFTVCRKETEKSPQRNCSSSVQNSQGKLQNVLANSTAERTPGFHDLGRRVPKIVPNPSFAGLAHRTKRLRFSCEIRFLRSVAIRPTDVKVLAAKLVRHGNFTADAPLRYPPV